MKKAIPVLALYRAGLTGRTKNPCYLIVYLL